MTIKDNTTRDQITTALRAFENRDAVAAASAYAVDGVFIDPRYPEAEYQGREMIRKGFEWALTNLVDQPEFTVQNFVTEGDTCAVEVETRHAAKNDPDREFPQVFIVEGGPEGITRWRTYLPFPPEWLRQTAHETTREP